MTPDERHERQVLTFSRWHDAILSATDAERLSIESLVRAIVDARADPWDRRQNVREFDEILMGLMTRNHR